MGLPKKFDRVNAAIAAAVWLTSLIMYVLTQAPTMSFWDCGEFIACSYILGIPHPPGTPTYILFARLATMMPTFDDIAARVNVFSGLCSSLAVLFAYLLGVRVLRQWFEKTPDRYGRFLIYAGAASGSLFLAFGRTQWGNAVEAEVYGMSMLIMFAIAWLTMVFLEHRETLFGNKIMLLAVYLAFLGIGVHMTTLLILPITIVAFSLKKDTPAKFWFILAAFFAVELYLILALSSLPGEIPFYLPVIVCGIVYIFYMLSFERIAWQLVAVGGGFFATTTPGIALAFELKQPLFTWIGLAFFAALISFGLYLIVDHRNRLRQGVEPVGGALTAGIFVVVTALLTGITKLGLQNGPDGYHVFLFLSIVLAVSLGVFIWRYINLPILIALVGPTMIILGVREFFWGTLISAAIILVLGLIWKVSGWRTALFVLVMAVTGYSTHLFPPIRSSLDPYINENNPSESLDATIDFYERKQYGSQSMTERMFKRRGEWENQFGNHIRMGFWGFFQEQYGFPRWTFAIAVLLGLLGLWEACRRRPEMGVYLTVLLLVATAGLVLYMNFADGVRQTPYDAWTEVRDRDYFFTPGFMLFGLLMGLGITAAVQLTRDLTQRFSAVPRNAILYTVPVLFLLPVETAAVNHYYCDRSDVYIPYDYAYNILQSCEPNAVLLTYGDNDTFPLWCMQEVYGVRRDVKSVCCALANGTWYIKQVRNYMGLELGWTEQEIDDLRPFRTQDGKSFRLQDMVADAVIAHNSSKRPIQFSLLANPGSRRYYGDQIDSLLEMRGLTYILTRGPAASGVRVPIESNAGLLMKSGKLMYRGWTDPTVYRDEMTQRSIAGVTDRFMALAEVMMREKRWVEAADVLTFVADSVDRSTEVIETLLSVVAETGDSARLETFKRDFPEADSQMIALASARARNRAGDATAKDSLRALLEKYPDYRDGLDELMKIYIAERDFAGMVGALETWMRHNPNDKDVQDALTQLRSELERVKSRGGDTP
jgi:uncharacterized membrane protein YiaA